MYVILLWIAAIVLVIYFYFRQVYTKFSRYGVKHFTPIPPFGNMAKVILKMDHWADSIGRDYRSFPEQRFVGRYEFTNSRLIIRDLELIKKITVKDFEYFSDHRDFVDTASDPISRKMLLFLKGNEWKNMRSSISPVFISSKIRVMVPFMVEVGEQMIKALMERSQKSKCYMDVDVKDMTTRYANDVIASCTFGLNVDSYKQVNNKLYEYVKAISTIKFRHLVKVLGFGLMPKLMKVLGVCQLPNSLKDFFRHLVMSTMKRNIIRPDIIHLLMEAKKEWSEEDLIAQVILFSIAGFETVSSAMSFLLHELAVNPDVQEKLYQEIVENEIQNKGKFDYMSIQQMRYMNMVVSEALRLWPPTTFTDRVCNKDYNCGKPNDKAKQDFILSKGDNVLISIWGIHRDPQYFPDPLKFDPERFSDENKHKIHPLSYIPFGLGPRSCIGSRFALCEVKVMTYQLLKEMKLSPAAKTCIPAKLSTDTFSTKLVGGHWVRMTLRN